MDTKKWEGFYYLSSCGKYDALYLNTEERLYYESCYIELPEVGYIEDIKDRIECHAVGAQIYYALKEAFIADHNYREWGEYYERTLEELKRRKGIIKHTRQEIWDGLNCRLSYDELNKLLNDRPYEKDDYYDFNLFVRVFKAYMSGKLDQDYFVSWCILLQCLYDNPYRGNVKINAFYCELAYWFDGLSFIDDGLSKGGVLGVMHESLAELKYFDHRRNDLLNKRETLFHNDGVAVYVAFDCCNWGSDIDVYQVFVADTNERRCNFFYADDIDFYENINYTFCEDIEDLKSKFVDYELDRSFGKKYIKKWRRKDDR